MAADDLFLRRAIVFGSAIVYWIGVFIQARRIRRQIGRSPNVKPRGPKEKVLWVGWFLVIAVWLGQPFAIGNDVLPAALRPAAPLLYRATLLFGSALIVAGYAGTLWCYSIMGDSWRMGINRKEQNALVTRGPFGVVRHPIYLFQIVMLVGAALLLPTWLSLLIVLVHVVCVLIKATDEESYLLTVHGDEYRAYRSRTGRLFPKWPATPVTLV
jgi:protein-S-isoprenylcysteine O-methyltransferase Ste14